LSPTIPENARSDRLRIIYEANYVAILGYALRRVPRDDAADVVAETFSVAWRRLDEVPEGDEARLWLYGTARRVLANQARARRRRERLTDRLRDEARDQVSPDPSEMHASGAIAAAFERLSGEDRELLGLVAWEGLEASEVARVLGCSRNAVRIRLHRARLRLARELDRGEASKPRQGPAHLSDPRETYP
jgi:RNA polymerase sigma-70 factor, ECF subfamily